MPFQKGNQLWREANHGGHKPTFQRLHTDEEKARISKAMREWHRTHINPMEGRKHSGETKKKMSLAKRGSRHPNWMGGITPPNELARRRIEYKEWRLSVYKSDKYICQLCGVKCNKRVGLNAHHIKSFSKHPNLRLDINNGVTLCDDCHKKFIMKGNQYTEKKEAKAHIG